MSDETRRKLLAWSDRGVSGPKPHYHRPRARDRGPVMRLVEQTDTPYTEVEVLSTPPGADNAQLLLADLRAQDIAASLTILDVWDPSDHAQLFAALAPLVARHRHHPALDVVLSSGTPQMQTMWVILVQAGLLPARMLQVIPPVFVPDPHPHPVRVVQLDIEGFPEVHALREEVARLRAVARAATGDIIGESAPMQTLRRLLGRIAAADVPILILGETGAGKERVARAIHQASPRGSGPFVSENCGAFAEGVLESELFGHEKGAFTGASSRKRGLFEQAHGGTLFLDEVGELSPRVQVLLLRVLQEGVIRRVGGEAPVTVDVRILAATHRDIPAMTAAGEFREDLYYRLAGAILRVPPLRERAGDVDLLVAHFLRELGVLDRLTPTPEAMAALRAFHWPGNVRQLRAEVVRWTVFCDGPPRLIDLSPEIQGLPSAPARGVNALGQVQTLGDVVEAAEQAAIRAALQAAGGNRSQAARLLEIDRNTLRRKMRAYDIAVTR
ncbi:MAG: sigma-54 dependent transcriptional regulator [Myxococcota bacterium]